MEIQLTNGLMAHVDEDFVEIAAAYTWCPSRRNGRIYPQAYIKGSRKEGKCKFIDLAYLVMGRPPTGMVIDHIDGNPMNNTRANLRFASPRQNARNSRKKRGRCSHKGVHHCTSGYYATIRVDDFWLRSKPYPTEDEAGVAYNQLASTVFGEFARLNTIKNPPPIDALADYREHCSGRRSFAKGIAILESAA